MTNYKGYNFLYHPKFKKEFNKILKQYKCPTLKEDFKLLYDILTQHLQENNKFEAHMCMHIAGLDNRVVLPAFIIKKFRCEGINKGSNSGFRLTFIFDKEEDRFIFVEMYRKKTKKIPNKNRINELFKKNIIISEELYKDEENFLNNFEEE